MDYLLGKDASPVIGYKGYGTKARGRGSRPLFRHEISSCHGAASLLLKARGLRRKRVHIDGVWGSPVGYRLCATKI